MSARCATSTARRIDHRRLANALVLIRRGGQGAYEFKASVIRDEINRLVVAGMRPQDAMVVAPFNAQVKLLTEQLQAGVAVGMVDKFQRQEAPVVFFASWIGV